MGRKKSTPNVQAPPHAKPAPEKKAEAPPAKGGNKGQKAQPAAKEAPAPAPNAKGGKKGGKNRLLPSEAILLASMEEPADFSPEDALSCGRAEPKGVTNTLTVSLASVEPFPHIPDLAMELCTSAPAFALATDPNQQDRATEIKILSARRPHMRAFHFAWLSFFTAFLGWFAIPPLMPTLKAQLGLSQDQVYNSNIVSVSSTILGRVITGPLCDRYGSRTVQAALLVVGALPVVSAAFVTTYTGFMVVRFFIGLVGCCFVATAYWTSVMFASNIVGSANAIAAGWGNLGAGAAYLFMPLLFDLVTINGSVSDDMGWRITLCLPAVLMVMVGGCLYQFSDDCPQGNYAALQSQSNMQRKLLKPAGSTRSGLLAVGRLPVVWILAFQYACSFGIELQVHNVLSLYYYQDFTRAGCDPKSDAAKCRSLTQTRASLISSLFGLMCIFSRAAGGYASDLANQRWRMKGRVAIQFAAFAGQALFLYLYSQSRTLSWSIPLLILFGFFVQACTGSTYAIVPYVCPQYTGVASGIVGAGGNVGALCWGFLFKGVGRRAKAFEYLSAFVGLSALLSAAIRVGIQTCPSATEDGSYGESPSDKCEDDTIGAEKSPERVPGAHYALVS